MPSYTAAARQRVIDLKPGDKAPTIKLTFNNKAADELEQAKGKPIVLYFYPKDDTPGCTIEAKDFRDNIEAFKKAGAVIIGASRDTISSHKKFQEKYCLPFALGSDAMHRTCEAYGVWIEKSMYGKKYMGVERTTFLIDGKGIIRRVWHNVKVDAHVAEVLKAVQELA